MNDGHFINGATIAVGLVAFGVLFLGGGILFFTFRHWKKESDKDNP